MQQTRLNTVRSVYRFGRPGLINVARALCALVRDGALTVAEAGDALPDGGMAEMTSIPLAVCASMIARGELTTPGVHAPEAVIDPEAFFDRLSAYAGDRADGQRLRVAQHMDA